MALNLILIIAAFCALVFWLRHAGDDTPVTQATWVKTASMALLMLYGFLSAAPALIVLGLAFGAVGDYALSRKGDRAFLAGMIAFGLGHLAYAAGFLTARPDAATSLPPAFWSVFAGMIALCALTAFWIAPKAGRFKWPVRAYALVIAAMALSATFLHETPGRLLTYIGVTAFVASDLILALRLFVFQRADIKLVAARMLWPLYWGGQALILWGAYY